MNIGDLAAFCVNLDRRVDRWTQAQAEFARIALPVVRWPAVMHQRSPYRTMHRAAAGCLDSHRQIWQHCIDTQLPAVAVFEDDVVFASDFAAVFADAAAELPADWHVWHLHATHAPHIALGEYVVRIVGEIWGTHGYIINPQGCRLALELPDTEPVDVRISRLARQAGGQVYGVRQTSALVFQRGDDSDIPRTAKLAFWREQRARFER